jgi:hypothetical protein
VPSAQEESNEDPVPDIARDMTFETFREAAQVQEHSHPSEPSHFSTAPSAPEATENLSSGEDLWGVSAASSLNDTPIDLPRFEEADEYQIVTNPEIFVPQDGDSEAPAAAAVSAPEMVAPTDEVLSRWASDFSQQPQAQQSQTQLAPSGNEDLKEWVRQEFESKFREELRQLLKEELNAVLKELGEST